MERSKLFTYAVIFNPTEIEVKEGKVAKIISEPQNILARTVEEVSMKAIKSIPSEYDNCLDRVDVVVRPF